MVLMLQFFHRLTVQDGIMPPDVTTIAKYYYLSIGGFTTGLMHLHCDGEKRETIQADCRTFYENGTLTHTNRYDIKEITHNGMDNALSHNDTMIFQKFVELVNSQTELTTNLMEL